MSSQTKGLKPYQYNDPRNRDLQKGWGKVTGRLTPGGTAVE